MNEIYIIYLNDYPYKTPDGSIYFLDKQKAKNYRDNLIKHIGRELYLKFNNEDWYEIGEERKQYWFKEADKKLSVKTYILKEENDI